MLQRKQQPMPDFVRDALQQASVVDDYNARPAYQRNDYLMWINAGHQHATKQRRLAQMIDELKQGGVYMNMDHPASRKAL